MPGWLKTLLIIIAAFVLLIVLAIAGGVIYVMKNKDAWRAQGQEIVKQGREFGSNSDNQGCVVEAISRYKKDSPGYFKGMASNLFMQGCFETSKSTKGFCDRVPVGQMMELAEWRAEQCRQHDLAKDPNCERVMFMQVVMFCAAKKRNEN